MNPRSGATIPPGTWVPALAAAAWVWSLTSFHGPGLDNDCAEYLAASGGLVEGRGWLGVDGRPYVLWPPLHPLSIAAVRALGVDALDAVRILHAASAAAIAILVGSLARRAGATHLAATAGSALAAIAAVRIAPMAWSETVFTALVLVCAWCWLGFRERPGGARFAALSIALALAFAQRYVGALLVATFAAALALSRDVGPAARRWARAASLALLSSLPVLAWIARNRLVAGDLDGRRGPPSDDLAKDFLDAFFELFAFVPRALEPRLALALVPLALVAAGSIRLASAGRLRGGLALAALPVVFAAGLVVLRQAVEFDAIDARLMSPALPFVAVAGAVGASALLELLAGRVRTVLAGAILAWTAVLAFDATAAAKRLFASARTDGIGLYDSAAWRGSPTIAWLREHPLEDAAASNESYALYVLAGARAEHLPARPAGFHRLVERWSADPRPRTVVWFPFNDRARFPAETFEGAFRVERTHALDDGEIWTIGAKPAGE
jgi:hypothetical protein